ncbi:cytochrome c oxidase biogenesis protein Cmc1 like protein [Nitzschia inconspicua]|uniref:COX assembly mitochondrial protein n=1 Tax=Nitzschia inconspicua TaxID=303405 RepID=A0A9K3LYZ4_9STRA|nr:cytochrome c oxidase biogenesis protein Cmc1 like protein [Nitzschia inconspicua]
MHPPLDRPHPDCQPEIDALRHCHATESKLKFWACNEIKSNLDECFKQEKKRMLQQLNANLEETKNIEQAQAALAFDRKETFQEFLAKDKEYQKDLERERLRQQQGGSWFSSFFS